MRAAISKTSAPWSIPTRSTRISTSSPGSTVPRKRAVQPSSLAGRRACPSVAVTTCWAAADSHIPCTIGDFSPASSAAARSVWIGLWSPETTAKGRMSIGAVIVTSRRRRLGVSVALSDTAPPARGGAVSSAAPVRPRMAKRSSSVASDFTVRRRRRAPTPARRGRPRCHMATEAVAVTINSAHPVGSVVQQMRGVVQMHQAQQALDDRQAGVGDRSADRSEHSRPAAADQGVGHHGQPGRQRRAERGGDAGVVGNLFRVPDDADLGGAAVHGGQRLGPVDARGDRQHRAHRGGGVICRHDGRATVADRVGQREPDVDPGARQRHAQHDGLVPGHL